MAGDHYIPRTEAYIQNGSEDHDDFQPINVPKFRKFGDNMLGGHFHWKLYHICLNRPQEV